MEFDISGADSVSPIGEVSLDSILKEVILNRYKILEDFCKAYIADNHEIRIGDVMLVESRSLDGRRITWHFERRPDPAVGKSRA